MSETYSVHLVHTADEDDAKHIEALKGWLAEAGATVTVDPGEGDVDCSGSQVTVVVLDENTWRSARVDAVLAASLPKSGVMALLLPSYDYPSMTTRSSVGDDMLHATTPRDGRFWAHNIPLRLFQNYDSGIATLRPWTKKPALLAEWLAHAVNTPRDRAANDRPVQPEDLTEEHGWTIATVRALEPAVKIKAGALDAEGEDEGEG